MYTSFYGLNEKPFDLLPNPDFLYPSRAHKRALTYLAHGIRQRVGFILLTGEVGSGKTTIIRNMIRTHLQECVLAKVFNTRVDSLQLLVQINDDFGLDSEGKDKAGLLRQLNDFLIEQYARGRQSVLIVDEAQNLSPEILEEVRMLSNLETDRDKLLQIILVGQPELRDILAAPNLLQLRQRIQINCHLHPLSAPEIKDYIYYRLEKAGNRDALDFSDDAIDAIARYTRGIPRLVNILCDYIMIDTFAAQSSSVDGSAVDELATDLAFESQYWEVSSGSVPEEGCSGIKVALSAKLSDDDAEGGAQALSRVVSGQAKILKMITSLNKRLQSLEALSALDDPALLDFKDRLASIEQQHENTVKQFLSALSQVRLEFSAQIKQTQTRIAEEKGTNFGFIHSVRKFFSS